MSKSLGEDVRKARNRLRNDEKDLAEKAGDPVSGTIRSDAT